MNYKIKSVTSIMKNILCYLSFIFLVTFSGCATKPDNTIPPSVSTAAIKSSLKDTQNQLDNAGQSNTKVAESVDKALTLAEQLKLILDEIEKEQKKSNIIIETSKVKN